ncbi:hypothetical protein [Mesorhizobium sp. RIZ17]|uniref:hypothetical protein n=1 Tax=Mesorhizobium sp. RIZ17 TaxID=3132743 RepID=UPI003DA7F717
MRELVPLLRGECRLVPIRTMRGGSACHMCGRCAGFKQMVALEIRSPSHEIVNVPRNANAFRRVRRNEATYQT